MKSAGYILAIIVLLALVAGAMAGPLTMVWAMRKDIPQANINSISNELQSVGIVFTTNDCTVRTDGTNEWWLCAEWAQHGTSQAMADDLKGVISNPTKFKIAFTNLESVASTVSSWGL